MKSSYRIPLYALLGILVYFPLFGWMDWMPLRMYDEGRNAVNAVEMLWSGNYLVTTFQGHSDSITGISLTSDNTTLVSSSKDGSAIVWDLKSRQILNTFKKCSGTTSQAISNVIVCRIPRDSFLENYSGDFIIMPFGKFVKGSTSVNVKLTKQNWKDIGQDFKPKGISSNIGGLDVIQDEEINIKNRLQRVLYEME